MLITYRCCGVDGLWWLISTWSKPDSLTLYLSHSFLVAEHEEEEVEAEEEDPLIGHMRRSVGVAVKEVHSQPPRTIMREWLYRTTLT